MLKTCRHFLTMSDKNKTERLVFRQNRVRTSLSRAFWVEPGRAQAYENRPRAPAKPKLSADNKMNYQSVAKAQVLVSKPVKSQAMKGASKPKHFPNTE